MGHFKIGANENLAFNSEKAYSYGVTRKGVAEQGFCDCALCVNARFDDQVSRVDSAVTFIDEGDEFDHLRKGLVLNVHGVHGSVAL
jgi:hypothetical protein